MGEDPVDTNGATSTEVDSVPESVPTEVDGTDTNNGIAGEYDTRNNINDDSGGEETPSSNDEAPGMSGEPTGEPTGEPRSDDEAPGMSEEDDAPIEESRPEEAPTSIPGGDGVRKLDFDEIIDRVKILTADPSSPAVLMTDPEDYAQFITGIVNIAVHVVEDRINDQINTAIDTRLAEQRTVIEDAVL